MPAPAYVARPGASLSMISTSAPSSVRWKAALAPAIPAPTTIVFMRLKVAHEKGVRSSGVTGVQRRGARSQNPGEHAQGLGGSFRLEKVIGVSVISFSETASRNTDYWLFLVGNG